jgi:tetratricopeptide (TPR) repeat protein
MLPLLAAALMLTVGPQSLPPDRSHAEDLARAGRTREAMELFVQIVAIDPGDVEARLWVARLALRLGRTADADAWFRSVLREHPADVDARIGLGMVLTRMGAWQDALAILSEAERDAGDNADLMAALARAYRRGGDDRRALEYFTRARTMSPDDPDVISGFEAVARTYGHWVAFEGIGQGGAPGASVRSGTLTADVRVAPRLHLEATGRIQNGPDYSDTVAGAGFVWRAWRATTVAVHVLGGSDNVALPRTDIFGDVVHYAGAFEIGGSLRRLSFVGANVGAVSPVLAWNPGDRWRTDGRYTYSRSSFDASPESSGDHSVLLRQTWQGWRRAAVQAAYAYGIESFEDLTADRLGSLGTTTVSAGLRIDIPSLTRITTTWEHQWRSNDTRIDRVTVSVVQWIP